MKALGLTSNTKNFFPEESDQWLKTVHQEHVVKPPAY